MSMPEIEVRDVHFSYKDGQTGEALRGVDLTVRSGELLCVIGPSGCGKSTLLRLLAGLELPDQGEIRINGEHVTGPGADRMIVFQDYALFPWLTARSNISFALRQGRGLSRREAEARAGQYLERVGLSRSGNLYPFQLSGGMRQRVAISRALAMDTDILLMDEPFGALDTKIRSEMQSFLLSVWQGEAERKTVVFVTHDIQEAILLADRIVFMGAGRVLTEIPISLPRPRTVPEGLKTQLITLFEEAEDA